MTTSRRNFLAAFPAIVPAHVLGKAAPSNLIQLGQIGFGRIARTHDVQETLKHTDAARFVAVADLDAVRLADGKQFIESYYERNNVNAPKVKTYADYREILRNKSIDAVVISTPDHWHAQPAIEAALAGKDVYLQKPASLTIREGRQMADTMKRTGRIMQLGSQQRSSDNFRLACELVRNGRIGKLKEIYVGLPEDPGGGNPNPMPVPKNLNYEAWLGSTPNVPYTEDRVHPQTSDVRTRYGRPGWLRCEQFGAGMITGWGVHHIDIAHWAMDTELTGPVEINGNAVYPKGGLWDVHGPYHVRARYANGVTMYLSEKYPNGLRFIGENGWLWVTRGRFDGKPGPALNASDPRIITGGIKDGEIHLHVSPKGEHHYDWLTSVKTRKPPATPPEVGHRSCSACLVAHAAMKLGRTLKWDPAKELFLKDDEANAMLARPQRAPYGTDRAVK